MPVPRLIHPLSCTVSRIDRSATLYDPEAREPLQQAARYVSVVVPGQPRWASRKELEKYPGGTRDDVRGYVLFRKIDLDARSFTIEINDRILAQGFLTDEVYVVRVEPNAHYTDRGGATLLKAWFTDRQPSKVRGEIV